MGDFVHEDERGGRYAENSPGLICRTSIISRSNVPELSKKIIQKGLAFVCDWSGTVAHSGNEDAQRSCPAGSLADAGLRWCGATSLQLIKRISNVNGFEEISICVDYSPHCHQPLAGG